MCLCIACGLRCYTCTAADPKSCTDTKSCPVIFNRCFSLRVDGKFFCHIRDFLIEKHTYKNQLMQYVAALNTWWLFYTSKYDFVKWFLRVISLYFAGYDMVTKGCQTSIACVGAVKCCEGNLCNSAKPTGSSVILLFASSAIITLFL